MFRCRVAGSRRLVCDVKTTLFRLSLETGALILPSWEPLPRMVRTEKPQFHRMGWTQLGEHQLGRNFHAPFLPAEERFQGGSFIFLVYLILFLTLLVALIPGHWM